MNVLFDELRAAPLHAVRPVVWQERVQFRGPQKLVLAPTGGHSRDG